MFTRRTFIERLSTRAAGRRLLDAAPARRPRCAAAAAKRDYFKELGVRPFINAAGTFTDMTASLMPPEVMDGDQLRLEALRAAHRAARPHRRADRRRWSRPRPRWSSSGAASAMTLGTAGVLTGTDSQKIVDLPNLAGMKSEVIMQKSHRFGYDHAVRNCGVKIVEVETAAELEARHHAADGDDALLQQQQLRSGRSATRSSCALGKKHGVVTMNDCAADVPPVENLWKYTAMGFDLVAFSGGKGIRGPQSAGLLLGRKDLIAAARANAAPNGNAIGRGMKVNKEEMLGHAGRHRALPEARSRRARPRVPAPRPSVILKSLAGLAGRHRQRSPCPRWRTTCRTSRSSSTRPSAGITGQEMSRKLREGTPSIGVRPGDELLIGVWMMQPGEDKVVAKRLREVFEKKA